MSISATAAALGMGCLLLSVTAAAETVPEIREATVRTVVSEAAEDGIRVYRYTLQNGEDGDAAISSLEVDVSRAPGTVSLSSAGLTLQVGVSSPSFDTYVEDQDLEVEAIVPIGCSAPSGWACTPTKANTVRFDSLEEGEDVPPGSSRSGFVLRSRGAPRIGMGNVEPYFVYTTEGFATEEDEERAREAYQAIKHGVAMVVPAAPPVDAGLGELCRALLDSLDRAAALGWLRSPGFEKALRKKVEKLKAALERGQRKPALNVGRAFLQQVEGASCPDVDCPGNRPIQAEARAVLRQRMRSLLDAIEAGAP